MKISSLHESISHHYREDQANWPGIKISKIMAEMLAKMWDANSSDDIHIQILPRQEQWYAMIKASANGKHVVIDVEFRPKQVGVARIYVPRRTVGGASIPGRAQPKDKELDTFDIMNPDSFKFSTQTAYDYLAT